MDDVMVCRLMAIARKEWPGDYSAKSKLTVVKQSSTEKASRSEMMVCQMRALIREKWPDEFDTKPRLRLIHGGRAL